MSYFNKEDCQYIFNNITNCNNYILNKTKLYKPSISKNNIIQMDNKKIYVLSDIHSDFPRFIQLLYNSNIIKFNTNNITQEYFHSLDILYDFDIIDKNFMLIIAGDLINGRRPEYDLQTDDITGDYELRLFIFLTNLKYKANLLNSDVLWCLGNHEYFSLITETQNMMRFRCDKCLDFYKSDKNRINILLCFLLVSPYYFIILHHKRLNRYIFICHAGLNNSTNLLQYIDHQPDNLYKKVNKDILYTKSYSNDLDNYNHNELSLNTNICKIVKKYNYDMMIYGHCTINVVSELKNKQKYINGCEDKKCILAVCGDKNIGAQIVFVDIGLSKFHDYDDRSFHEYLYFEYNENDILHQYHRRVYTSLNRYKLCKDNYENIEILKNDFLLPDHINKKLI
jgi:hypothetical protein